MTDLDFKHLHDHSPYLGKCAMLSLDVDYAIRFQGKRSLSAEEGIFGPRGRAQSECVHACAFGSFRVWTDTCPDLLPSRRKARGILAILIAARGAPVARSKIAGLLWDRVQEDQARGSLRQDLSALTQVFAEHGVSIIEADRTSLRVPENAVIRADSFLFIKDAMPDSDQDLSLFRLPLFEDLDGLSAAFDQWLREERTLIANKLRDWHERRIARLERETAAPESIIAAARALIELDPTHERGWRSLIRKLIQIGDIGQARGELENCRSVLRSMLDIEPAPETLAILDENPVAPAPNGNISAVPAGPATDATPLPRAAEAVSRQRGASLLILPFAHDRNNRSARFLSSGVLEGTINILSAVPEVFVIGRGSAVALGARENADPRELGAEMGVGYVVAGSISTAGQRHRIYIELIETATGAILRTEILDAVEAQIFEIHDHVAQRTAATIAPTVRAHELLRLQRGPRRSLTAYEHLLLALEQLYRLERSVFQEAGNHLQRAMQLDPGFGTVQAYAATWHSFRIGQGWSPDVEADSAAAARLAESALACDPNNSTALSIKGQITAFTQRDLEQARQYLDMAVQNAPSNSYAWALRSATSAWTGLGATAVGDAERALRLSPLDPFAFFAQHMISQGYYVAGDYELAALWGERARRLNPRLTSNLRILAAASVALGDSDGARALARQVLEIEPHFRIAALMARTPLQPGTRRILADHLRAADLPDR